MWHRRRGLERGLEVCHVFANYIIFKHKIYCSFLWSYGKLGVTKLVIFWNFINVWSHILAGSILKIFIYMWFLDFFMFLMFIKIVPLNHFNASLWISLMETFGKRFYINRQWLNFEWKNINNSCFSNISYHVCFPVSIARAVWICMIKT